MSEKSAVHPLSYQTTPVKDFNDQRGLIVALGALLAMAALVLSAIACAAVAIELLERGRQRIDLDSLVSSAACCFGLSVLWVLSYGTIQLRRWIRPAFLLLCVFTFCASLVPLVGALAALPSAKSNMDVLGLLFMTVLFGPQMLVASAIFVFFNSKHVKRTLEHYDPAIRWTDRYPLPVLGMMLATLVLSLLCAGFCFSPAVPFFGSIVGGHPQTLLLVILGSSFAFSTLRQLNRRMSGVVIASATLLLIQMSIIYSACLIPIDVIAAAMGARDRELDLIKGSAISSPLFVILTTAAYTAFCLGYAYHNRHYFHRVPGEQQLIAA